ncbi:hemagglutinin repeat-containing protein [Pandoraea captiosa]|uniref:hemagglutinin repeat-containing protein n=1 Tax=Pandoraea captiosa TaxID=2508302 RepID=UPI001FE8D991|nr:hemagglutinin repeat-containing protein [Pandoraea captiosa]
MRAVERLDAHGLNLSSGNTSIHGGRLDLSGSETTSNGELALTGRDGDIDLSKSNTRAQGRFVASTPGVLVTDGATLATGRDLALVANRMSNAEGRVTSQGEMVVTATGGVSNRRGEFVSDGALTLRGGVIENTHGTLQSAAALTLVGESLDNGAGRVVSLNADGLNIKTSGELTNASGDAKHDADPADGGFIGGNGAVTLESGRLRNRGTIRSKTDLSIHAQSIDNDAGHLFAERRAIVNAQTRLTNVGGHITAADALSIRTTTLDNARGNMQSGQLAVHATDLVNRGGAITQTGGAAIDIDVLASLDNSDGGTIQTNSADLTLSPAALINSNGTILHAGNGKLTVHSARGAQDIRNANGKIRSNGSVAIHATHLDNSGGLVTGRTGLSATLRGGLDNTKGKLLTNENASLVSDRLTNDGGEISAGSSASVHTQSLTNHSGAILAPTLILTSETAVDNSAGEIKANHLSLSTTDLTNPRGVITHYGTSAMTFDVNGAFDNANGGVLQSNGTDLILRPRLLNNNGGTILAAGRGKLKIAPDKGAGRVLNDGGRIVSGGELDLIAARMDNAAGELTARGNAMADVRGDIQNSRGRIRSLGSLSVNSQGALENIEGQIQSGTEGDGSTLSVKAVSIDNGRGLISHLSKGNTTFDGGTLISNRGGVITGSGRVALVASKVLNTDGAQLSGERISVVASALDNTDSDIGTLTDSVGDVVLETSDALTSTNGRIGATRDLKVSAATLAGGGAYRAANDVTVSVKGNFTTTPALAFSAGRTVKLSLPGTFENATTFHAVKHLDITAGNIVNSGSMTAGGKLTTRSDTFRNTGSVVGADLSLNAGSLLSNVGATALIGATNDQGTLALLAPSIENLDETTDVDTQARTAIYGLGRIVIAGGKDATGNYLNANLIRNQSALIQSGADMALHADRVVNTRRTMRTSGFVSAVDPALISRLGISLRGRTGKVNTKDPDAIGGVYVKPPGGGEWNSDYLFTSYWGVATANTVTSTSPQAQILSGANLNASSINVFQNHWSAVAAAADIEMPASLDQNSWKDQTAPAVRVRYSGHYHYDNYDRSKADWQLPFGDATFTTHRPGGYTSVAPADIRTYALPAYESTFVANGVLSGTGVSIDNAAGNVGMPSLGLRRGQSISEANVGMVEGGLGGLVDVEAGTTSVTGNTAYVDPIVAHSTAVDVISRLTIPQGGLFRPVTAPDASYLIESNPAFTNAKAFISSDYYLHQIGVNPQTVAKRLGDGMYEQHLVRSQITALTGKIVPGPYTDLPSMYEAMMRSGAALAKSLDLYLGMSLSAEQVAALTHDVVILQSQVVDGQPVLVPVVYLAPTTQRQTDGPLIAAADVRLKNHQALTNSGTIRADRNLTIDAERIDSAFGALQSGGLMTLTTVGNVDLSSATVTAGELALKAGGDLLLNTTSTTVDQVSDTGATRVSTTLGPVATLTVEKDAVIATGGNFQQNAGTLNVGGNLGMAVGGNWELGSVVTGERKRVERANGVSDTNINRATGSIVNVGGVTQIGVGADVTATGADLHFQGGGAIAAQGDVSLRAAVTTSTVHGSSAGADRDGSYYESSTSSDDAVIGTRIRSGDSLAIAAGHDIDLLGSGVTLERGTATLVAGNNVNIGEVTETHESHGRNGGSRGGFLSSQRTASTSDSKTVQANGSMVSADAIVIAAGKNLDVRGSTIVGTKDVALQAGQDLHIQSAQSTSEQHATYEEKRSGFGVSGGVGVSYGNSEQRDRTNDTAVAQTSSLVGSLNGSVSMVAGNDLTIRGSDVVAGGNVTGIAKNITVESATDRQQHDESHEMKRSGFTLAIKSPVIDAAQNVVGQAKAAVDNGGDARVSALRGYAAASGAYSAYGEGKSAVDALAKGKLPEGKVELSWGESSSKSTSSMDSTQNVASHIRAGGAAALIATGDAATGKGNVNVVGSDIDAKDVLLQATNEVNLLSSADSESTRSDNQSKNVGFGVSYGTSGFGVSASFSRASGDANSDSTFQNNTHVNASRSAVIASGGDTNLAGASVSAERFGARVGGDLNIASVQDTSEGSAHQESMGGGVNLSMAGASGSASYARGNASSNYASVVEQSGIKSGDGGFDIGVAGNTDLKGGYITSTAGPEENRLTTGTLTFSDIENHADYSANSFGFGGGFTVGNGGANERKTGKTSGKNTGGISPMLPQMESGSERGTTRAGVSEGTITLTDESNQRQDLASLNRDTTDLNGTVARTPDLQNLLSDQSRLMQAATAAGEAVARDIGTYADKKAEKLEKLAKDTDDPALKAQYLQEAKEWSEGGDYRAAMHAAGGALVAGLGGGNALGGALGAGLTSKLGGVLNDLSDEIKKKRPTGNADVDEALGQIVATVVGTAVGAAAGGTSGAFTGFNTDRFNRQLHPDEKKWISAQEAAYAKRYGLTDQQAHDELTTQANLQVQNGSTGTWNQRASNFLAQAHGMLPADGASGPGYMFYATPDQKANVEMYAKHYPDGIGMNAPNARTITESAVSDQTARDKLGKETWIATTVATSIATGGVIAAIPGSPIFGSTGALGSGSWTSPVGIGAISGGVNAASQYYKNGEIRPFDVGYAALAGWGGTYTKFLGSIAINAATGAANTMTNNFISGKNDSVLIGAMMNAGAAGLGYGVGAFMKNTIFSFAKSKVSSYEWSSPGVWAKPSGRNIFTANNTPMIGSAVGGATGTEAATEALNGMVFYFNN